MKIEDEIHPFHQLILLNILIEERFQKADNEKSKEI
jgi:hypothetical protein